MKIILPVFHLRIKHWQKWWFEKTRVVIRELAVFLAINDIKDINENIICTTSSISVCCRIWHYDRGAGDGGSRHSPDRGRCILHLQTQAVQTKGWRYIHCFSGAPNPTLDEQPSPTIQKKTGFGICPPEKKLDSGSDFHLSRKTKK